MAFLVAVILLFLTGSALGDVGIICTLQGEEQGVLDRMKATQRVVIAERDFYRGELEGSRVVVVRSPMGKVNNAITAQILISHFHVESILSIGLAGALDPALKIGDVVLAGSAIQHDFGLVKPYGFIWESPPELGRSTRTERFPGANNPGVLVSGDQFICSEEKREWLRGKFHALAVDMSAAAIHEVCRQNYTGCLFIRTISDRADLEGRESFREASLRPGSVDALWEYLRAQPKRSR